MCVLVQGQAVTIEGREGLFLVIRVNIDLGVADILRMTKPRRIEENVPLQTILIPAQ